MLWTAVFIGNHKSHALGHQCLQAFLTKTSKCFQSVSNFLLFGSNWSVLAIEIISIFMSWIKAVWHCWLCKIPRSTSCRYRMDYMKFVEHHRATDADITIGCLPIDEERASDFGLMKIDEDGRITVSTFSRSSAHCAYQAAQNLACLCLQLVICSVEISIEVHRHLQINDDAVGLSRGFDCQC